MSNSNLISCTILSPNNSGKRTHAIDRITPHCVSGQCTAEALGGLFAKTSRGASSNYGVGADGKIGLYVDENNRSWCTSSKENDQRAITIEVASDNYHPYKFLPAAYNSLIDLCTDICQRNGKTKLLWFNDKDKTLAYEPQPGEMVITIHRWYSPKACPGDWLVSRLGELAAEVNARLFMADGGKAIWDYLRGKGLTAIATAGVMGNLFAESGLNPINLQDAYEGRLCMDDAQYTAAVDNGTYTNFLHDGAGYGLAQWTWWSRKDGLLQAAKAANKSVGDPDVQLAYLWKELVGYGLVGPLNAANSVKDASNIVLLKYEQPKDQSEWMQNIRAEYSQGYYDEFCGDEDMTGKDIIEKLSDAECYALIEKAQRHAATLPLPTSWDAEGALASAVEHGITDGARPMCFATRLEAAVQADRAISAEVMEDDRR